MTALLRLLRIRPEESPVAGRMLAMTVLLWTSFALGGNAVESLLLARVGPGTLPLLYIALGVVTCLVTIGAGRVSGGDPRRTVPVAYLLVASAAVGIRAVFVWESPWSYRIAWLAMMVLWTLAGLSGWSLAGALHDTRQAKRLFPIYGAGLVVGLVGGGLLTGPLAALLGTEQLVFVWAGGTAGAALLARSAVAASPMRAPASRSERVSFAQGARAATGSRLLRWMAVSVALFALLFFALTFLFARGAAARFPEAERLAGFLGAFSAVASGTALLVSLLVANRLFARVGTVNAVLVLPVLYLAGFGALAVWSSFPLLVGLRFAQIVWVNGVWAPAWQSMFNVVPGGRRPAVRAFVDAVPLQAGVIGAGALLLVAEEMLGPRQLAALGAVGSAIAVAAMLRARSAYVGALADALREGYPEVFSADGGGMGSLPRDRQAVAAAAACTRDPDPSVRRLAVTVLAGADAAEPVLSERLADDDASVRLAAVRAISRADGRGASEGLRALLADPDARVRAAAAGTLARRGDEPARARLAEIFAEGGPGRAVAAAELADAGWDAVSARRAAQDLDPAVRAAAMTALARIPGGDVDPLIEALADPEPVVRTAAARALRSVGPGTIPDLMRMLDDASREEAALEAFEGMPPDEIEALLPYARERAREAARLAAQARGLSRDDERTALLAAALEERCRRALRLALLAMGRLRPEAVRPALDNLWSEHPEQRANAIEILDAGAHPDVARLLVPVWEGAETVAPEATITELIRAADPWLRACAALAAGASADRERVAPHLRRVAGSDPVAFVREAADQALEGRSSVETLATLSLMDRVLFLRRVPLFAGVEPDDLRQVAEAAVECLFEPDEVLAREGERGDTMHVVVSGEVAVVLADGRVLAVRASGEHVGEMVLVGDRPRMASLVARGKVRTLSLDRARFERIVRERPAVALGVIRVLGERLREASLAGGETAP